MTKKSDLIPILNYPKLKITQDELLSAWDSLSDDMALDLIRWKEEYIGELLKEEWTSQDAREFVTKKTHVLLAQMYPLKLIKAGYLDAKVMN